MYVCIMYRKTYRGEFRITHGSRHSQGLRIETLEVRGNFYSQISKTRKLSLVQYNGLNYRPESSVITFHTQRCF